MARIELQHRSVFKTSADRIKGGMARPQDYRSLVRHNVAEVVSEADAKTRDYLDHHYGARGGTLDLGAPNIGFLVPKRTKPILEQAQYLSELYGRPFSVLTPEQVQAEGNPDTLIVPYQRRQQTDETLGQLGQEIWGLPWQLVEPLKDKASFHNLVKESSVTGFEVPDFKIANKRNLMEVTHSVLRESEALYEEHGLADRYPKGVVIRSSQSDGNYGMVLIRQTETGEIKVSPDGTSDNAVLVKQGQWDKAFTLANEHLQKVDGDGTEFVVSRLIDKSDDPGLSLIITDGEVHSLGWNGQVIEPGTTACVGTADYETAMREQSKHANNGTSPDEMYRQKKDVQLQFEDQTVEDFESFLRETTQKRGIDFTSLSGAINVDIMIPGELEKELRRKRGQKPGYYIAECNPRWTNYSDALMVVAGATGKDATPHDLKVVRNGGVMSYDKFKSVSEGEPDFTVVRNELITASDAAKQEGGPFAILRMPDHPKAGIILVGDPDKGRQIYNAADLKSKKRRVLR